jgi:hypothetical protein
VPEGEIRYKSRTCSGSSERRIAGFQGAISVSGGNRRIHLSIQLLSIIYMNPTLFREILPIPLSKAPKESPWNEK